MKCERCKKELTGKQKRWCSQRCSRLGLKNIWRKRNQNKVNEYNRKYRELNPGGFKYKYFDNEKRCYFCTKKENLHKHHLNYEENIVVCLCSSCHYKYHNLIKHSKI